MISSLPSYFPINNLIFNINFFFIESDSDSSEDTSNEKDNKTVPKISEEGSGYKPPPPPPPTVNGTIVKDITAKSFAQFSENLKELIAKILEISKEEKTKYFNSKLNTLLLRYARTHTHTHFTPFLMFEKKNKKEPIKFSSDYLFYLILV